MIFRLFTIYQVVRRYRLDTLIPENKRGSLLPVLFAFKFTKTSECNLLSRGQCLREALETLGPVFIKFGQFLSTRQDLLPDDIVDELALLQDQVPPFPTDDAITSIEKSLGASIHTFFANFEHQPLAAASLAQVHIATLHTKEEVVVKVLRPDITSVIHQDLKLIKRLAFFIDKLFKGVRRLRLVEVSAEYERILLGELDLRREAGNASQLRRNVLDSNLIYVPKVHWSLTTKEVMVSERIDGVPVGDVDTLNAHNVDMQLLAERGVEVFFNQVFRDNFFHADMHPGNIFVNINNPSDPRYFAVDCAIIGQLDEDDLYYLAQNLLAIFKQDYRLVAKLHVECGWVSSKTSITEFESAIRTLCEPIFERPLSDVFFGQILVSLFRTAGRFDMEVQPQLVLLQKTLLNIEGLGRRLYPELNLWDTAQPFLEHWLTARYAPLTILRQLQRSAPVLLESLPMAPDFLLARLRAGPQKKPSKKNGESSRFRRSTAFVGAIIGGAMVIMAVITPAQPLLAAAGGAVLAVSLLAKS